MKLNSTQWLGVFLVVTTSISCVGWVVQSYEARELVGSPFMWAAVLIGFFLGIGLTADPDRRKNVPGLRRKLILYYLASCAMVAVIFLVFHVATGKRPLVAAQAYTPFIIFTVLISYIPFYLFWGSRAGIAKRSSVLMPALYLVGVALAPVATVDLYNLQIDEIELLPSPHLVSGAKSNFVQFSALEILPDRALYDEYHRNNSRNSKHSVTYTGLVPVNTGRQDTLYEVWISFEYYTTFNKNMGEDSIKAREQEFFEECRKRIHTFKMDSVVFFDKSKQRGYELLNKVEYPLANQSILMKPVYTSLKDHQQGELLTYLILFIVAGLIFWGVTAIGD